jgi:hypothetical protein
VFKGKFIDLFNPNLPVIEKNVVIPGTQSLLYDLSTLKGGNDPKVLASSGRIYRQSRSLNQYSFIAKAPINTTNNMRIFLPKKSKSVRLKDNDGKNMKLNISSWDKESRTLFVSFENRPSGVHVFINY